MKNSCNFLTEDDEAYTAPEDRSLKQYERKGGISYNQSPIEDGAKAEQFELGADLESIKELKRILRRDRTYPNLNRESVGKETSYRGAGAIRRHRVDYKSYVARILLALSVFGGAAAICDKAVKKDAQVENSKESARSENYPQSYESD